jgi:RsiW-degrading membrane proteinase PrsW (M82 family)
MAGAEVAVRRRTARSVIVLGILIALCAAATIGIGLYFGHEFGALGLAVGLVGAIIPVPVLVGAFLWLDRYQPARLTVVLVCLLWGTGGATSIALFVNTQLAKVLARDLVITVTGPITEEICKAALPLLLYLFYRRAYSGIIDGIVLCGLSATGFAMVENILYVGGLGFAANADNGYTAGVATAYGVFVGRVLTGFIHPLATSMTGIGIGIGVRSPRRWVRVVAPIGGLIVAAGLHASWNTMTVLAASQPYFELYGYFSVFVPLFIGVGGLVLWLRSREGRLPERVLGVYAAAGWFSPPEVLALGPMGRRLSARAWARRVAGADGLAGMKAYQAAATRLAQVRDGLDRGLYPKPADVERAQAEERDLLAAVEAQRQRFVGRDPFTPWAWWNGDGYQIQFPDGAVRAVPTPPQPVVPVPIVLSSLPGYDAYR